MYKNTYSPTYNTHDWSSPTLCHARGGRYGELVMDSTEFNQLADARCPPALAGNTFSTSFDHAPVLVWTSLSIPVVIFP